MNNTSFIEINNLVNVTQIIAEKRDALEALLAPWIPTQSKVLARLVRSSLHAGDFTDYVVIAETALYFASAEASAVGGFDYKLKSVKCFAADSMVGYGFILGDAPEFRLLTGDGKMLKLRLDTTLENSHELNPQLMQMLANSKFLTCNILELCDPD